MAREPEPGESSAALRGEVVAFERLYRSHVARVHTLARRILGEAHADQMTQDVFVRAWQKLGTFRGEASVGTWLHRLALNAIFTRRSELARVDRAQAEPQGTSRQAAGSDLKLDLEAAIARLPRAAREVFVLHDVEGHRHRDIAELLAITTGTSKSQLHRARMLLREMLSR